MKLINYVRVGIKWMALNQQRNAKVLTKNKVIIIN